MLINHYRCFSAAKRKEDVMLEILETDRSTTKDYCKEIAEIIAGYRLHDRNSGALDIEIDKAHVERWISQFDSNQEIILEETANLLRSYYFSKENVGEYLTGIYSNPNIWGEDIEAGLSNAVFLDCQSKGKSQHKLYKKSRKIIQEQYDIDIDDNGEAKTFVYVDDCMFSGLTAFKDLNWLVNKIPDGSRIIMVFIAVHSFAEWWVKTNLTQKMEQKNIKLEIWRCGTIQNSGGRNSSYDCLWPKEFDSKEVQAYLETIEEEHKASPEKKVRLFRESRYTGGPYSSERNRAILEQALMEAGLKIIGFPKDSKLYMRPMGYDNRISFGFGAFFATYMNMSNNCPLAYWWGDKSAGDWNPLSKWYPLLPRKVNEQDGEACAW